MVTDEDWKDVGSLTMKMANAMEKARGIGLAAPQIGMMYRIFIVNPYAANPMGPPPPMVYVNPVVKSMHPFRHWDEEGCLSLPGKMFEVERAESIVLEARDVYGISFTIEAEGWFARVLQHEMDHLDGMLIDEASGNYKEETHDGQDT
jgi:peptide deformylase